MKIEIDNDVYHFLQSKAVAFQDTPNSVLRRLLIDKDNNIPTKSSSANALSLPKFSYSIPSALQQILELVFLIKVRNMARDEATSYIAKNRDIAYQSVIDKYCRQLSLTANEVDDMLRTNINKFKEAISKKHYKYSKFIDDFFVKYIIS